MNKVSIFFATTTPEKFKVDRAHLDPLRRGGGGLDVLEKSGSSASRLRSMCFK